jgi:hypothetical protein
MSLAQRCNCLFALLAIAITPILAQVPELAAPATKIVTAKIKLDDLSMIIVPVSINASGPYDFLLDTGCGKTIVYQKLAEELGLLRVGENTVAGVLASTRMSVVHVDSLSVAGATVAGGELFSSDQPATVTGKVRGVLGGDFLKNFDLLIDYRHQNIRLESPLGPMAQVAMGERLPLQLNGMRLSETAHNRLVVSGHIPELGDTPMLLLLDSGANVLTLFRDKNSLGQKSQKDETVRAGSFNRWVSVSAATGKVRSLRVGNSSADDLIILALARRADADTDGLLPTSLFKSVLISSRGGFVILNPSFPRTSR